VSSTVYAICAFECYRNHEYISANKLFKSINDFEKDDLILFYIANCYVSEKQLNEGLSCLNKSIEIDNQNSVFWFNKGFVLDGLGKSEEAINAYNESIKIDPNNSDAWNNKGVALSNLGKSEEAINAYNESIKIDPNNSDAWNNKGVALNHGYDVNKDCVINIADLTLVSIHFGEITKPPYPDWDVNQDGVVNVFDFSNISKHYGQDPFSYRTINQKKSNVEFYNPI